MVRLNRRSTDAPWYRRPTFWAYAWLITITVISFVRFEEVEADRDRESQIRDYKICVSHNELRKISEQFVIDLAARGNFPGAQHIIDLAERDFAPIECPPEPED